MPNSENKSLTEESSFYPQILTTIKGYSSSDFIKDLISGLIVAIIALPLSIALALCSGVGPEEGLYTAVIAGLLVSLLGGTKVQISGPTAAFATIIANIVAKDGFGALGYSTLIAGFLIIVFGIFKFGRFIKYIPFCVVVGFTAGIAVTIFIGQFKDFFGITYSGGERPVETLEKIYLFVKYFNTFNLHALIVGILSFVMIILWPKVPKVGSIIPSSLMAVLFGVFAVKFYFVTVNTIGSLYTIREGLPHFNFPLIPSGFANSFNSIKNGVIIAVLASIESLLSARVADDMTGDKHRPNTELVANGIANIACALFGAIPATGAIARTAANIKNGGKTPIAGMFHALILLLVLLFLMPLASLIPMPTIAAILFSVAYNMSGWQKIVKIFKEDESKREKIINISELLLTFILTVCFDLIVAIAAGLALHFLFKIFKFDKSEK